MKPRRPFHRSAWKWSVVLLAALVAPARAQLAEVARTPVELPPDPLARSARLLGMGRLTLLPDRNNHIDLWDFAGNLGGIYDTDSVSVLDLRPSTTSSTSAHDFNSGTGPLELQDHASNDTRLGIEAVRRPRGGTAYGLLGEITQLRSDAIYSVSSERRSLLSNPLAIPVISGRLPFLDRERMRYTIHGVFGLEDTRDEYRALSVNTAGLYVDHAGTLTSPPDYFNPDEYFVRRMGGGLSLAYVVPSLQAAVTGRLTSNQIAGTNDGERYSSETEERRPIFSAQGTVVGRLGKVAEAGADAQIWSASSDTRWVFTISPSGGPGPSRPPLTGRGELSSRKEQGSRVRLRGRWMLGRAELGGSLGTLYRNVEVTPAPISSATSFNRFRYTIYSSPSAADTVYLPDDVLSSDVEQRDWEAAAGLSTGLLRDRATGGVEFHYVARRIDALTGQGAIAEEFFDAPPIETVTEASLWDVRGGLEYRCTPVLLGRLGYIFRNEDRDANTEANEFISHTVSAGLGIRPEGVRWSFDAGYAIAFGQADFGDPTRPRLRNQQLGVQVRWDF